MKIARRLGASLGPPTRVSKMAAVALLDRVRLARNAPDRTEKQRVDDAIDTIESEVDSVSRRLAVIDPEWQLIVREKEKNDG